MATIVGGVIDVVVGLLTGNFSQAWNGLKTIVKAAFDGIVAVRLGFGQAFINVGTQIVMSIWNGITGKWQGCSTA